MRSYISLIALSLAFVTCYNVKVEAGSRRITQKDEMEKKAISKIREETKNGSQVTKEYRTGSARPKRVLLLQHQDGDEKAKAGTSFIVQDKKEHQDATIFYHGSVIIKPDDTSVPPIRAWLRRAIELYDAKPEGFKEYAETKYGPHLRTWAKLARTFNEAKSRGMEEYIELRNEKINERFPMVTLETSYKKGSFIKRIRDRNQNKPVSMLDSLEEEITNILKDSATYSHESDEDNQDTSEWIRKEFR